jgi:hypothetical protein
VLDAKGGENKGQSNKWISYHLRNFENSRIELLVCQNSFNCLLCQKLASCGEKCWLWEKGGVFEILDVSTSGFDLEIGIWVWFAKTNQVVAKSDPYMPNLIQNNFWFSFALILHLF